MRWTEEAKELGRNKVMKKQVREGLTAYTHNTTPAPANSHTTNTTLTTYIPFVSNLTDANCCAKVTSNLDKKDTNLEKPTALYSGLSFAKSSLGAE